MVERQRGKKGRRYLGGRGERGRKDTKRDRQTETERGRQTIK